jgi:hypothetical protein
MYHARHILIPATLRHTLLLPRAYNHLSFRHFSVTPRSQASANPEDPVISKVKNSKIFRKLADNPEAVTAIQEFGQVLRNSGVCSMAYV